MRSELLERAEAEGPPAPPRIVCEEGFAYRLTGAGAELLVEQKGQAGSLRHLAMLGAGAAAFGLAADRMRLVLIPKDGATVETIALPDLAGQADLFVRTAEAWVAVTAERARHLAGLPAQAGPADGVPSCRLEPGLQNLAAGEAALPGGSHALLWCQAQAGAFANIWGRNAGHGDLPVPVLRSAPLHAERASEIQAVDSAALARKGTLLAALAGFNVVLGRLLQDWCDARMDALSEHVADVADADAAAISAAMARLAGRGAPQARQVRPGLEPPLAATIRTVARAMRVRLPADFGQLRATGENEDALALYTAKAGLRSRELKLQEGWWRKAGEAMVGQLRDGTPVALLPARSGWRMVRPGSDERVRVDDGVAASLTPHAHVLYRGFSGSEERPGRALAAFVFSIVRGEMALIALASLAAGLLAMATPFLSGMLIQSVIPDGVRSEILQLILVMVSVAFGMMGFELVRGLAVLRVESVLGSAVEGALWSRLLRLSPGFFRRYGAGDLALRADAVNQIRRTVGVASITALLGVLFSCVNLVVLLSYGLKPALLALAVCAVQLVILLGMTLFELQLQRRALANSGAMQTLTVQIFQGISKLRVAAAENRFLARWTHLFAVDQAVNFRANVVGSAVSAFGAGWNILVMAALIGLVGFGGVKMTLGDYVTYSGVSGQFVSAILSLAGLIPALATVLPLWERARPILVEPTEDDAGSLHPGTLQGEIEASRVSFGYPGGQSALSDVSLRIPAGAFVALVGPSGSGKSSLLRLLLGFDQPDSGSVLLDGHDLRDLDRGAVRRQLGVVLQHSRIEAGSLYHNIAGTAPLSLEAAFEAASLAGLGPDIAAMPMGLHTYVDDAGATLSGGQRQRLLLARAIARRPRIMLLDEATSALDNATQAHVMATLAQMNVTRVVVAHRLSTVRDADLIYVLSEGRIVEQGDYATLAAAGGVFAGLIHRQMA
ncbi:MAG TPA: NHLP bacteriocin export ABC transporter permease/ATPase subunit [Bosea sp. (in: a-proteobacteria)]|uniref:NHLP bacteriocin export ABC transporter permease/ATPase subunit n=1 Tax=Bosea sp. (in: a-proteobacteria) TaxID=1871050 RepID=UPI002E0F9D6D|nr:NHLP bacteriocin export ABC transporter permease/ATPase subunit [Bosea sp. (in: a-proteobacteria)]